MLADDSRMTEYLYIRSHGPEVRGNTEAVEMQMLIVVGAVVGAGEGW